MGYPVAVSLSGGKPRLRVIEAGTGRTRLGGAIPILVQRVMDALLLPRP